MIAFTLRDESVLWRPIDTAPEYQIIWVKDSTGNVGLAVFEHGDWNCELGILDADPVAWQEVSIAYHFTRKR